MERLARRSATLAAFLRDAGLPAHALAAEHIAEALRDLTQARLRRVA
jgi:Mn-dependent DtxR family transcriptional regulator